MKKKKSKANEILWITMAVACSVIAIHKTIYHGLGTAWYFYGFIIIAIMMYYIRKNMRKK